MSKGRQKLYNVIKVYPKVLLPGEVPAAFLDALRKKGILQERSIKLIAIPMDIATYKKLSPRRYAKQSILYLVNNHIIPIDCKISYIMKYPMLLKGIIDAIFEISGKELEDLRYNPDKLFQLLRERRREMNTFDALLDNFVLANLGIEQYLNFRKIDSLEERLSIVASLEFHLGVIIEERYELSKKIKRPIKLTPDRNFQKEYDRIVNNEAGQDLGFGEIKKALAERMAEDKKLEEYGIKRTIRTEEENKELFEVDGIPVDRKEKPGSSLRTNLD